MPDEWKKANVVALYKGKGERTDPTSYRPISVTSVMIRFFERIILNRLWEIIENKISHNVLPSIGMPQSTSSISDCQAGFRAGYSCQHHLLSIRSVIDDVQLKKAKLPIAFLDISKAYDTGWLVCCAAVVHYYSRYDYLI